MNTEILNINPKKIDYKKINLAAKVIKNKGLVAFPTETVYGLGANALDPCAVSKIFITKGRPQDNPLIVHIADKSDLIKYVTSIPRKARKIIDKFWPGPITLVFKKKPVIPDIVTCGLNSVAIRMPINKIALSLIKASGVPIAAPSANLSGKPSTTCANHVLDDLDGKIDMIIDGGEVDVGIESTVLSLVDNPVLLRSGKISVEEIEQVIGKIEIHNGAIGNLSVNQKVLSPGMKYKHYSPLAKVILVTGDNSKDKINKISKKYIASGKKVLVILSKKYKKDKLAHILFDLFRKADKEKIDIILIEEVSSDGIGLAIMNRIKRAISKTI